jgi:hypothetical protein
VYFAAAGNDFPRPILFPARHSATIAVGAASDDGVLLPQCCREPQLDLVAPGHQLAGLAHENRIEQRSGSSFACVIAAGVAALALSAVSTSGHRPGPAGLLSLIRQDGTTEAPTSTTLWRGQGV